MCTFPAEPPRLYRPVSPSPFAELERPRILVVDDEPESLHYHAACLSGAGMDTIVAESGERALEILEPGGFEAVLSDVRMPRMSGVDLLLAVRELDADLPVVLVSGCPEEDLPVRAMELAPGGLLLKPVNPDELVQAVSRAVRFCRLGRVARRQPPPAAGPRPVPPGGAAAASTFSRALAGLYLAWQPIVRSVDGSVLGHEAFVRTLEPSLCDPLAFFGVARDLDRIVDLGGAVRRRAAAEAGAFPGELRFVNVHPSEMADADLVDPGSPLSGAARSVVLEVSRRTPPADGDATTECMRSLRQLGFRIAIDDFGSGVADVSALERPRPDFVKLDLPLVRGLDTHPEKRDRVRSLVKVLHEMGIEVVAEGVETPGERHAAIDLGVDYLQGFLFGRPKPAA